MAENVGPIYGVPLIGSLPLDPAKPEGMRQAMPSRADLVRVDKISCGRAAAGYEVLLAHYLNARAVNVDLLAACKAVEWEGDDSEVRGERACPSCYAGKSEGHYAGCILAAAIALAAKEAGK